MSEQSTNWLSSGDFGVRAELPDRFEPVGEQSDVIRMVDPLMAVEWMFLFFPSLHMDLAEQHREQQRLGLEGPARSMFEEVHRQTCETDDPPRTADLTWSPMVDAEFDTIADGAPALRTVHRMVYRPGTEAIMGHWLVPLETGLFEVRVVTTNGAEPTGVRESALTLLHTPAGNPGNPSALDVEGDSEERQRSFDDPKHDGSFPTHPLSRARMALELLRSEFALRIDAPAQPEPLGRTEFLEPTCTLIPPPRFFESAEGLRRVTFCGTDGVQSLIVERLKVGKRGKDLEVIGRKHARRLHEESGVGDIQLAVSHSRLDAERELVVIAVDGEGNGGPLRNTTAYFRAAGSTWAVAITSTLYVDPDLIADELAVTAKTLEAPRKKRIFGLF